MRQFDLKDGALLPHFTIPGTFPSLNEYIAEIGRKPQIGGKLKREYKMLALSYIRRDLKRYKVQHPIILHYVFYEPNMKRDHDNVFSFCSKCVQDALQDAKVIENDGWGQILNFTHDFYIDKSRPRIEVYIEEIEDGV
jgi:Holliday junction resolvase RusA-like endonuclease